MLQLQEQHRTLHSLCLRPNVRFENQGANEEVLLTMRAHPITLLPFFLNAAIFLFLIFLSNFIIFHFLTSFQLAYINVFFILFIFMYVWIGIVNWYFNIGIVSNQQIIDVDFSAIGNKELTRTKLSHVEDITVKTGGFVPGLFDFGNIFVQTAGSEINTEFINIAHPGDAQHIIQNILEEYGSAK